MKKGLISIMAFVVALAGATAFAKAPTIADIPDVVVSDNGGAGQESLQTGLTVDLNFFRYLNAFDVTDYASDEDTAAAGLNFSFSEQTTHDDLAINGVHQLTGAESADAPPSGKIIEDGPGGFLFSFRDLVRSPGTSDPTALAPFADPIGVMGGTATHGALLPWHNQDGSDDLDTGVNDAAHTQRFVTLFATDGDTAAASKSFSVISINTIPLGTGGSDSAFGDMLSGGFNTVFTTDLGSNGTTRVGAEDWYYAGKMTYDFLHTASSGSGSGFMSTQIPTAGDSLAFGRWDMSPREGDGNNIDGRIGYVAGDNVLYCARFTIEHNQAENQTVPEIRLGVANPTINVVHDLDLRSYDLASANPHLGAQDTTKVYPLYWENGDNWTNWDDSHAQVSTVDGRSWSAYFDTMVASGNDVGTVTLTGFDVVTMDAPATVADGPNKFEDADVTAAGGWTQSVQSAPKGIITSATDASFAGGTRFSVAANQAGQDAYVLWEAPAANQAPWDADSLVRASFFVSCPSTANRTNFPAMRLRVAGPTFQVNYSMTVRNYSLDAAPTNNLGCPPVNVDESDPASRYSIYAAAQGGPSQLAIDNNMDVFNMSFDVLPYNENDATAVTFHKAMWEVLNDPIIDGLY